MWALSSRQLELDIIERVASLEHRLDDVRIPQPEHRNVAAWQKACGMYMMLPGLRGFWPMSSVGQVAGANRDIADLSSQGRWLTANGDPRFGVTGLAPYVRLDGAGDFYSRADEAGFDILGNEFYMLSPGLTIGCWFYPEDDTSNDDLMTKWGAAGQRSYLLDIAGAVANDPLRFFISDDGTNSNLVSNTNITYNAWNFGVGRYNDADAGEELASFANATKVTAVTARNSIFNSNASFMIGSSTAGGAEFEGRASLAFLCTFALPDYTIESLFRNTRGMFGV